MDLVGKRSESRSDSTRFTTFFGFTGVGTYGGAAKLRSFVDVDELRSSKSMENYNTFDKTEICSSVNLSGN